MKEFKFVLFVSITIICCNAQNTKLIEKADNLKFIKAMPYNPQLSGDSIYWVVIIEGLDIVPYLIEKLDDTTSTEAIVPNFGGQYAVADIAYEAISTIIHEIPIKEIIETSDSSKQTGGYWFYWNYVNESISNRIKLKEFVNDWYLNNQNSLIWVEYKRSFRSSSDWKFDKNIHPLGGYYYLKE